MELVYYLTELVNSEMFSFQKKLKGVHFFTYADTTKK